VRNIRTLLTLKQMLEKQSAYITKELTRLGLKPLEIAQLIAGYVARGIDPMTLGLLITSCPVIPIAH
jgi:hypothetical protein